MGCLLGVETKKSGMKWCSPYRSVLGQLGSLILPLCLSISKCEKTVRCPQLSVARTLGVRTSTVSSYPGGKAYSLLLFK